MSYETCRHIMTNGEECRSPRLSNHDFCFFHYRAHARHRTAVNGSKSGEIMLPVLDKSGTLLGMEPAPSQSIDLGLLEDRPSIQLGISTVLNALASGRIERSRATALLYGLQLASINLEPQRNIDPYRTKYYVTEMELSPEGTPLTCEDTE